MPSGPKFEAILQAVDKVSGPIEKIEGSLKGLGHAVRSDFANPWRSSSRSATQDVKGLSGHLQAARSHLHGLTHGHGFAVLTGHVRLLRGHFGNLSASIGNVGRGLGDLLPMLGGLGAVTSIAGIGEMVVSVAERASALGNAAAAIGMTTRNLLALNLAAEHTDVPIKQVQLGFEQFNAVLGRAAQGHNKQVAALFHQLGISMHDASGHVVKITAVLPKLMNAFKAMHSQAARTAAAQELFGRSGKALLPFLQDGAEAWRHYREESRAIDYDPPERERRGLEQFRSSWIDLRHAVESVETAIGAKLGPALQPIIAEFTTWVAQNRDWIAGKVVDAVKSLAAALKKIDVRAVVKEFGSLAKHVIDLASNLGPIPGTLGAITLALGAPLAHAIIGTVRDLKDLTTWAFHAARALGTGLVNATRSAGNAIKGLDAGFHATTIGRTAALVFRLADMARKPKKMALNEAQKTALGKMAVPVGHALSASQVATLNRLATPAHNGPSFDQRARGWMSHVLGLDGSPPTGIIAQGIASGAGVAGPSAHRTGAAPSAPRSGTTKVVVDIRGAPPGTRVRSETSGSAPAPELNVGFANPAFGY